LIVVEFQPSSWSKGTYLNVGVMWLWHARYYLSFDRGYRERAFQEAASGSWSLRCRLLAESAARRVQEIRDEIPNISAAAQILFDEAKEPGWPQFHAAVAAGLAGNRLDSQRLFAAIQDLNPGNDRRAELLERAREL